MTNSIDSIAPESPGRLHWLKYNPTEWHGRFCDLSDAEYGLYHRIVERLWRTPGQKLAKDVLAAHLRLSTNAERAAMFERLLLLQELREEAGMIDIPFLHETFAEAVARSAAGSRGGLKAAANRKAAKQAPAQAAH